LNVENHLNPSSPDTFTIISDTCPYKAWDSWSLLCNETSKYFFKVWKKEMCLSKEFVLRWKIIMNICTYVKLL